MNLFVYFSQKLSNKSVKNSKRHKDKCMKDEQTFKTIKIKKDVWKKLNYLKLEEDAKTISQIINKLIVFYEEKKG